MVNPHCYAFDRDRLSTDWRAVSIAVVLHALLLAAFVMSHMHSLATSLVDRTLFVRLLDAVTVPRVEARKRSSIDPAAAAQKMNRVRVKAVPDNTRPLQRTARLVPEGSEAPGDGPAVVATTMAPTSEIAGMGAANSQSKFGSGSASGPRFRPARVVHRTIVGYPLDAFSAHREGSVDVIVDIATDGKPVEGHVYQSSGTTALDAAAVAGVLQWTFRPAERNGVATQAQAIVTIDWKIGPTEIEHFAQLGISTSHGDVRWKYGCLSAEDSDLCKDTNDQHHRR